MKKLMMVAAALCCILTSSVLTSCSENDNPVDQNLGSAVIVVNTSALYDKLGVTDNISQGLTTGDNIIVDSVLIYDEAGALVSKLGAETSSLQPLTIKANAIPDGIYTLVAWQTIRDPQDEEPYWVVADEDKLSTVNITTQTGGLAVRRAIGMAGATVTVDGGQLSATVAPKPMGSIVDMQLDCFTEIRGWMR